MLGSGAQGGLSAALTLVPELWHTQGLGGFYSGLLPAMLRSFPANAAAFFGIDYATRALDKARHSRDPG